MHIEQEERIEPKPAGDRIPVVLASSLEDGFHHQAFYKLIGQLSPHHLEKYSSLCREGRLVFGSREPLAFILKNGETTAEACFAVLQDFSELNLFAPHKDGGLVTISFRDALTRATGENLATKSVPFIELGGDYIIPEQRGKGLYRQMFAQRLVQIASGLTTGKLALLTQEGEPLDLRYVFIGYASRGKYQEINFSELTRKAGQTITPSQLKEMGVDPKQVGLPRRLSTASARLAEKYGFQPLKTFSPSNLGPMFYQGITEVMKNYVE